jgi:ABC-type transporter Mla MlaB component
MAATRPSQLVCDISALRDADVGTVADLARLHVAARRLNLDVVLRNASDGLVELVAFVGLLDVLRVEPRRQPEQGEERLGVEEERELDDPPL